MVEQKQGGLRLNSGCKYLKLFIKLEKYLFIKRMLANFFELLHIESPWGISSAGRALDLHSRGQEFDSPILHHKKAATEFSSGFFVMGDIPRVVQQSQSLYEKSSQLLLVSRFHQKQRPVMSILP